MNDHIQDWNRKLKELGWWHSFEMPDGTIIEGVCSLEGLKRRLAQFPIPADLTGKRVLDIGAWDGYFSFELEKRGAEVVAVDCWDNERFRLMKSMLNSRVEYRLFDMYELTPQTVGKFDLVIFFGVLYHLKHPLLALERVCALTTDLACIDSFVSDDEDARPRMEFYEHDDLGGQTDNWVGPNIPCLLAMTRTAGFARVNFLGRLEHSACVAAYRHWETVQDGAPDGPEIHHALHDSNFGINFVSSRDEYIGIAFKAGSASIADVKPEVSGIGARPISVTPIGSGFYQANFKLPPGLSAGWHDVTLRLGDSARSEAHRIAIDLPLIADDLRIKGVAENATWTIGRVTPGQSLTIWIDDLPENADVNNTRVLLNDRRLHLSYVGGGQINADVPADTPSGDYELKVEVGQATAAAGVNVS